MRNDEYKLLLNELKIIDISSFLVYLLSCDWLLTIIYLSTNKNVSMLQKLYKELDIHQIGNDSK